MSSYIIKPVIASSGIPEEIRIDSRTEYSPGIKVGTMGVLRGLTPEEEQKFLPKVVNVSPSSPNWDEVLEEYWQNFSVSVPYRGLEFNGSLDAKGNPVDLRGYILRGLFLNDNTVGKDEDVNNPEAFNFILIDKGEQEKQKRQKLEADLKADKAFAEFLSEDVDSMATRQLIQAYPATFGIPYAVVREMDSVDLQGKLRELKISNPEEFVKLIGQKNLKEKGFINALVEFEIIRKEGNSYYDGDVVLGSTSNEMLAFVLSQVNSAKVSSLQARLEAKK